MLKNQALCSSSKNTSTNSQKIAAKVNLGAERFQCKVEDTSSGNGLKKKPEMNLKNTNQVKHLFSSADREKPPTKIKVKAVVCERNSEKTLFNASTTGSSEHLTETFESKKVTTNITVAKKILSFCENQKATCSVQKKPMRGGLPNFFKPTKSYLSSLTEKKKSQQILSQDRLIKKTIKNKLPLKKKSLPVVVSNINDHKCKRSCLSKIDTEENLHGQRTFICKDRNIALDSPVRPIRPITEFNMSQHIRSENSKEVKDNETKFFSKKPSKLLKDRINDLKYNENKKTLKKKKISLSLPKKDVALPKTLFAKALVSGSVISINVSSHVQMKQKSVPYGVLKKNNNKFSFVNPGKENLQNKVNNIRCPYAKSGIKNANQYSTFSKPCRGKNLHISQNTSQLKEIQTPFVNLRSVNCCTKELSEDMIVEGFLACENTNTGSKSKKNQCAEGMIAEQTYKSNFGFIKNSNTLHRFSFSEIPIIETSCINLTEDQVVSTGESTEICSRNDTTPVRVFSNHILNNCLKSNINKSRLRVLSEMLNSKENLPLYDSHRHLGDWMILVDLAVAEKVCEKEKFKDEEPMNAALQSLGSLSLLAAGAADVTRSAHVETCRIPIKHSESKNLSFQDFSTGSRQGIRAYSPRLYQASRSLSPQQSCCTPIRRSLSGNEFSILKFGDRDVELCIGSKRTSRLHSSSITFYETPIPQVTETEKNVDATLYSEAHDTKNNLDLSRLSVLSSEFSSTLVRAPRRNVAQGRSKLLRAIGLRNAEEVRNVITTYGIDPNDYITVPTTHIPWIAAAPTLWLENSNKSKNNFRSTLRVANCRLHLLHIAAVISSQKVVQVLISMGSCVNALDNWCRNPLHCLLQPPPMAFLLRPLLLENEVNILLWDEQKLVNQLFMFLLKQTMIRSSVETKIAEVLCQGGININSKEKWSYSCLDYAKIWVSIRQLIQSDALLKFFKARQKKEKVHSIENISDIEKKESVNDSDVITVAPRVTLTFSSLQKHLLSRIPDALLDVVFLHEDRLRLKALSSIVGVRVGGSKSAHETVYINITKNSGKTNVSKEANYKPFTNYFTPKRDVVSRCNSQNMQDLTDKIFLLDANAHLDSASSTKEYFCDNTNLPTHSSIILSHLHCIPPTPSSGQMQTCTTYNTPTGLGLSCLRALEKNTNSVDKENKIQEECSTTKTIQDNDLLEFLRLLSAPTYRFHPAFSGVWEYLGATVFPQEEKKISLPLIECKDQNVRDTSFSSPLVQDLNGNGNLNVLQSQLPAIHSTSLSPFPLSSTFI